MKRICWVFAGVFALAALTCVAQAPQPAGQVGQVEQPVHHWSIVVHGGAGVIARTALGPNGDAAYRTSLAQAEAAGARVLDQGGSALDAVEAVIKVLEDDPLFNAGREIGRAHV